MVVTDVPTPTCRENEILVQTAFSVISTGTETWTIDATEPISANELVRDSSRVRKATHLVNQVWKSEGVGGLVDYVKAVRNPQVPLGYSSAGVVIAVGKQVTDLHPWGQGRVRGRGEGDTCGVCRRPPKPGREGPRRSRASGRGLLHDRGHRHAGVSQERGSDLERA